MATYASLILSRLSSDPTIEDDALAHLLAFMAQDVWFIREKLKGL